MASARAELQDRATAYTRAVLDGRQVAGRWVRLACKRHVEDLEQAPARGLVWDLDAANYGIEFFEKFLVFGDGPTAGTAFLLEPWEAFIVGSLFGWYSGDGSRRFRTGYVEIGKGSGKSPLGAGCALKCLVADNMQGAQCYTAATTKEQAKISFRDAELMCKSSPALGRLVTAHVNNLAVQSAESFLRPISSEHRALDGKRVHFALIDEVHEHPSATVVDKMRAGTKGSRNALILEITNSGYDPESVCWQHHDYSIRVLERREDNDQWFAYVAGLDACAKCYGEGHLGPQENCRTCDDWRDETTWIKANPNLGVSIQPAYLAELVREAIGMPAKQLIVKRLNFCIWTQRAARRWIGVEVWDGCKGDRTPAELAEDLRGLECFAGLDLSETQDLSALVLVFPAPKDRPGLIRVLCRQWCPENALWRRREVDKVPYELWAEQGYIKATPGRVIDYNAIREEINAVAGIYRVREVGYDPHNAVQIVTDLTDDGLTMVPVSQRGLSLSPATKDLERLIHRKEIRHGGHPILRWNAANAAAIVDGQNNVKLVKSSKTARIDGIAALVNAVDRMMRHGPRSQKESVYAQRARAARESGDTRQRGLTFV